MRVLLSLLFLAGLFLLTATLPTAAADDFKLEPGFTPFFNGKNLDGWKLKKDGSSLEGKTDAANKRFVVTEEKIVIDPKVKGDIIIETAKEFDKDVEIKFEFKPGAGCNNDLFLRGAKFDIKKPDIKNMKEGEWNEMDIVLTGDKVEFKVNGESIKKLDAKAAKSPFGVRAEAGPIEIRRMRYKQAEK